VRCMAHIANLAVQALLYELKEEVSDDDSSSSSSSDTTTRARRLKCITKLRRLGSKIRRSYKYRGEFKNLCVKCDVPRREIILDTRTRWNSTYAMIKRAYELRAPLSELLKGNPDLPQLSDDDWKVLHVVAQVLSVFDDATRKLSATRYPTLNHSLVVYNHLIDELEDFYDVCNDEPDDVCHDDAGSQDDQVDSQDDEADIRKFKALISQCSQAIKDTLKNAIQEARDKMCDYYGKTWGYMYAVALVLDPRYHAKICLG
jgi:hypothetical protein